MQNIFYRRKFQVSKKRKASLINHVRGIGRPKLTRTTEIKSDMNEGGLCDDFALNGTNGHKGNHVTENKTELSRVLSQICSLFSPSASP